MLKSLDLGFKIFKDDPAVDEENGVKELRIEYFIVSVLMLLRHLRLYYAVEQKHYELIRSFVYAFHERWQSHHEDDRDILLFSDSRQQSKTDLEVRDRVMRQAFFEFLEERGEQLRSLDKKRVFNEAERIRIYRKAESLCEACLAEGKTREEAQVSWGKYQADHIMPWIKGGATTEDNAQVLCQYHNAKKNAKT